jgi:hypothetical protein
MPFVIGRPNASSGGNIVTFIHVTTPHGGSRGSVLSFHDLLDQGGAAFPPARAAAIHTALSVKYDR